MFFSDNGGRSETLEAVEVGQEAFEEGEDEEQVHKGSGMIYFNHHNS